MRSRDELDLIAAIADDLAAGIWVATVPDGRFAYANRAFEEIMGIGGLTDVAVGQYSEPYGIYDRDGVLYREDRLPFVRALQTKAAVVVDDIVIHRRDGRRVFVRAHGKPMFDARGEMTHIAIAFFDITPEVEAERARDEAQSRLRRVIASAPIVLWAMDREGIVTFCEGSALQALGREPRDFVGQSAFGLYVGNPAVAEKMRRALAGESVAFSTELEGVMFDVQLAPLRNESGELAGAIGVATDVTARRRAQLQLAQAERLASMGMLAAGVAHEINNPLAFVIGNLDVIAERIARLGDVARPEVLATLGPMIADARTGADRVRDIVRGLKVFSRADEQVLEARDVRVPIETAIGMARNEVRHRAQLTLELAPTPRVLADQGRLVQLFLNLLINAAQCIPEGAAEKNTITVRTRTEGDLVVIEVIDTGVGVPSQVLPRIFDPFFTTKPLGVGTGLGLSICHAIVTDLGGRIEVDTEVGRGSTFRVLLPVAPRDEAASSPAPPQPSTVPRERKNERGRVLVIDDEPPILKIMSSILSEEHEVVTEMRADAALARISAGERFDAIVCDLMMPDMTGMELHEVLAKQAPDQARAMIFVTGGAFTAKAREFLEGASRPTIEKPFDAATLLERVRRQVG
jgi:two-component system cell cycle sensor histidine kinase/response regulator CckA